MDSQYDVVVVWPDTPGLSELLAQSGVTMGALDVGIGIWDKGQERIIGAAIYNNYDFKSIEVSVYLNNTLPLTREMLHFMFAYPFVDLKCARLTARTRAGNTQVRRMIRRLGFKPEGRLRRYFGDDDAMIYGMLKDECKWIPANG